MHLNMSTRIVQEDKNRFVSKKHNLALSAPCAALAKPLLLLLHETKLQAIYSSFGLEMAYRLFSIRKCLYWIIPEDENQFLNKKHNLALSAPCAALAKPLLLLSHEAKLRAILSLLDYGLFIIQICL